MDPFLGVDWQKVFVPDVPVVELVVRGTLVYLVLFAILRFMPNRQVGAVGISDLLVVVLFANAAQNAIAGEYTSITDGLILVLTIIGWSFFLNWLGYNVPAVQRLMSPPPLLLVQDGRPHYRNMRRELITEDELLRQLRQQGVDDLADVKAAYMENDGHISVVTHEPVAHRHGAPESRFG